MKLTPLQQNTLFNVANGHRWAVDKRSLNSLLKHGLIERASGRWSKLDGGYQLTELGDQVADQIEEEIMDAKTKKLA